MEYYNIDLITATKTVQGNDSHDYGATADEWMPGRSMDGVLRVDCVLTDDFSKG